VCECVCVCVCVRILARLTASVCLFAPMCQGVTVCQAYTACDNDCPCFWVREYQGIFVAVCLCYFMMSHLCLCAAIFIHFTLQSFPCPAEHALIFSLPRN